VTPDEEAAAQADEAMAAALEPEPSREADALAGIGLDKPATAPAPPSTKPGMVTLAPLPPLASVTLPGAGKDGADLVIGEQGAEVDEATAQHAREVAWLSGLRLREI
jgi:hypothetical protein